MQAHLPFPSPPLVLILGLPTVSSMGPELMLLRPPPSTLEDQRDLARERAGEEERIHSRGRGCLKEVRTCSFM